MHKLVKHIQADPVVKEVFDAKSEQLGPQLYRFKVEVEWDGSQMVQRFLADLSEEEREVCS
jgi:zinc transporter 9